MYIDRAEQEKASRPAGAECIEQIPGPADVDGVEPGAGGERPKGLERGGMDNDIAPLRGALNGRRVCYISRAVFDMGKMRNREGLTH